MIDTHAHILSLKNKLQVIENMSDTELKQWLTDLVKKDLGLGVQILINGGK